MKKKIVIAFSSFFFFLDNLIIEEGILMVWQKEIIEFHSFAKI